MTAMGKAFFSTDLRNRMGGETAAERVERLIAPGERSGTREPLNRDQEIEIRTLLPGYILSSQGDRMAMAHSVEGRFPFLDHRVVEFCMKIPPRLRMNGLTEKYILRKSMSNLLPREMTRMVKQPYRAPDARSFVGSRAGEYSEILLSSRSIAEKGYFDPVQVEHLVEKCRRNPVIGFKDNMAFVGILSTQLLDELFIRNARDAEEIPPDRIHSADAMEEKPA
jgi:asparagine synthase (glutamine-hydrolysing)